MIDQLSGARSIRTKIKTEYKNLSKSERIIADFVLNNTNDITKMPIAKLASIVNLSDATIIRFCKQLGLTGYQDLKISLVPEKNTTLQIIHEEIEESDNFTEIAYKVFASHMIALDQTLNSLDFRELEEIAKEITNSEKVDFYGLGGSGTVAIDIENKFIRTGINTTVVIDAHVQLMRTSLLGEKDYIIIISNTGSTKHYSDILNLAKKNKVKSVLITSVTNSPLAKLADKVIVVKAQEISYKNEPSSARIAMISTLDIIVTYIAFKNNKKYIENIYKTREALKNTKFTNKDKY